MNLLTGNTNKAYFTLLVSALSSTILMTVYSTVDIICVGQYLGPLGSATVACINPAWTVMIAPGVLLGIGGAVMMSNRRGAGDETAARKYFTISTLLCLLCAAAIFIFFYFFMEEMLSFFGAEGDTLREGLKYMEPMKYAAPTFTLCACLSTFIRNDGEAFLPTFATAIGGVFNIVFDIFFVFDFGLGLGIFGAGLATAVSQIISFFIILTYFLMKKCKLKFTKIDNFARHLYRIASVGLSVFLIEVSLGFVSIFFNKMITENLGALHLAIYGTVSTVTALLQSLFNTLGSALQPIASAGFGAGDYTRVKTVFRTAVLCAIGLGVLFTLFTQLFPLEILKAYIDVDEGVVLAGPSIFRKYTLAIGISGISIVISYYLQSMLKRFASVSVSLFRGLIFPCVFALLLSDIFDANAIWYAVPLSELFTLIISFVFVRLTKKDLKSA